MKERVAKERFDFIYYPGIREGSRNSFSNSEAILSDRSNVLSAKEIESVFDLRPPRDNRPYFSNFFRLEQLPEAWINLGKRWLPFGGSGFWLVVLILVLVVTLAFFLILFPTWQGEKDVLPPVRILKIGGVLTGAGFMLMDLSMYIKLEMIVGLPFYTFSLLLLILLDLFRIREAGT